MVSHINFEKVIELIYKAGENLRNHYGKAAALRYKTASSADMVTALDESTEKFLAKELKKLYPDIGFKGEEFGEQLVGDRFWLVDPIDGTSAFARGLHGCTTMLALIEHGEITASAIYDFVLDRMYYAQKGKGAYMNKKPIRVSNRDLKGAFLHVETHLNHAEDRAIYLKLYEACEVMPGYPAGIHFANTAAGRIEGRICFNGYGNDYDFAPGELLVQEAGGIVTNVGAKSFDYTNLNYLAVNREVYRDLTTGKNAIFPISK